MKFNITLLLVVTMFATSLSFGQRHVRYSGSYHNYSHGGHYSGGRGSSHKGGHYTNSRTSNHYGRHKR